MTQHLKQSAISVPLDQQKCDSNGSTTLQFQASKSHCSVATTTNILIKSARKEKNSNVFIWKKGNVQVLHFLLNLNPITSVFILFL